MHPVDEADETTVDPFSTRLSGPELVPNYLVSRFAAQYRVVVEVLLAAQDTSLTGMPFDEIAAAVRARLLHDVGEDVATQLLTDTRYHLDARLDQLEKWQVVTRWQEPARSGEDFLRRRDRYQLTPLAARLHTFWLEVRDSDDDESGEFTLAPRAIHERLVSFAEALAERRFVAAANEFQQVTALHQAMARAARGWQRTLAHALSGGPDQAKQDLLWRTLQAYIGMWGEQVDTYSPRISDMIVDLSSQLGPAEWVATVRAAVIADAAEELVQAQAQRWARTWDALATWFSGPEGQARRLRRQLRDLVAPWARNMHILVDTGGAVTRRGELLSLAEAIELAPTENDAWRIWNTAVGIFPARHLLVPAGAAENHALSWPEAPRAPVTARFREQGPRAAVGRRSRVSDYSKGRTAARQARAAAAAARAEAEARLRQLSGTRISDWGPMTAVELDLFLEMVGLTRTAGGPATRNRTRTGTTPDGRWRIALEPPEATSDVATLVSAQGRLVTVDWRFHLELA